MPGLLELLGQTWPARLAQSAWSAAKLPGDVYAGRVDPLSEEGIGRAADLGSLVAGGSFTRPVRRSPPPVPLPPTGIRAYHGSPHDFERFDLSKTGAGEGNQAWGNGIYVAENPKVAAEYRPPGGRSYEVNVRADPEHFYSWDLPHEQQGQIVKDALAKTGLDTTEKIAVAADDPAAIAKLRDAGVAGFKYLDKGSREAGKGTHNYVLFRDDIIDIVKKYGWAGLAAFGIGKDEAKAAGVEPNRTRIGSKSYGGSTGAAVRQLPPQRGSALMADALFGYKIRPQLYPGEDDYFRSNPHVTGMAAETGDIILNPYAEQGVNRDAVAKNEAFRLYLKDRGITPSFPLTQQQRDTFKGTAYGADEGALRSTIAARIYSGDPSAMSTPEQQAWVHNLLPARTRIGSKSYGE